MKTLYADKRHEKNETGYHALYHPGAEPNTWEYELRDPQGQYLCHGVRTGTEKQLIESLRKTIKRHNGMFAGSWSWGKTETQAKGAMA